MAARGKLYRTPGTGSVRRTRAGRYEARTSQTRECPHGERLGVFDMRFRADQAADAWFAGQQQKKAG